ncbi:MAG: biotin transporter BioY [Ktedonobacteraceae bacterium]
MIGNTEENSQPMATRPEVQPSPVAVGPSSRIPFLLRNSLLIIGFSIFVTLCARTGIDQHFPFQTEVALVDALGVLLTGGLLGSRRALLAMLVYLAAGAVGLPVFPDYQHISADIPGLLYFFAGQGGITHLGELYFWSYPVTAFVVGLLSERRSRRPFLMTLGALVIGALILTLFMLASSIFVHHLAPLDTLQDALSYGPGDLLLLLVVALIVHLVGRAGWLASARSSTN